MKFKELLKVNRACCEARRWVGSRSIEQAWAECERGDWMVWLLRKMVSHPGWPTGQQVSMMVADCSETALCFIPEGEYRPKQAIIDTRRWALGEDISPAHLRESAYAAGDAYADVAVDAADIIASRKWQYEENISSAHLCDAATHAAVSAAYAVDTAVYSDSADYATFAAYVAVDAAADAYAADVAAAYYDADYDADYAAFAATFAAAKAKRLRELAELIRPRFAPSSTELGLEA